jgi:PrcB C-terminal
MNQLKLTRGAGKVSAIFGILALLVACHVPAVTDSGNSKLPTTSKDATSAKQGNPVNLIRHESYALCPDGSLESGLNLYDDAKSWQGFVRAASQRAPQILEWKPNFVSSRIAVFRLGSKASGGYAVRAIEARLNPKGGELALLVRSTRPQAGSLNASVITSPCLVVDLASADFKAISVIEESDGTVLGKIRQ